MNMKCFLGGVFSLFLFQSHLLLGETVFHYRALGDRIEVLSHLESNPKKRVLDIGYSAHTWSSKFVTHYVDIRSANDKSKVAFEGDINFPQVWEAVEKDVLENGLFDYCICSHTLEDIINPVYVASMIDRFCKAGFIAVPSKFTEMTTVEGAYRGYIHHRYIYNFENGKLVGYPKLNFIEYDKRFDYIADQFKVENSELQVFWNDNFELKIINDNYMGPNANAVLNYYNGLLVNQ
jgi:hypothetical protein